METEIMPSQNGPKEEDTGKERWRIKEREGRRVGLKRLSKYADNNFQFDFDVPFSKTPITVKVVKVFPFSIREHGQNIFTGGIGMRVEIGDGIVYAHFSDAKNPRKYKSLEDYKDKDNGKHTRILFSEDLLRDIVSRGYIAQELGEEMQKQLAS